MEYELNMEKLMGYGLYWRKANAITLDLLRILGIKYST